MKTGIIRLSHEETALLMPAFIHGKLDTARQRQIQEHIAICPACARRHRQDLELAETIAQTPAGIEQLLTSASRERNRQRLMAGITPTANPETTSAANTPGTFLPARALAIAAGLAAVSISAMLLTERLPTMEENVPLPYRTQTTASPPAAPATGDPTYRVVFQRTATLDSIQQLLLELDAVVVGGPTEAGVYTLVFRAGRHPDTEILRRLRQRPEIVFAERSVHRDG